MDNLKLVPNNIDWINRQKRTIRLDNMVTVERIFKEYFGSFNESDYYSPNPLLARLAPSIDPEDIKTVAMPIMYGYKPTEILIDDLS